MNKLRLFLIFFLILNIQIPAKRILYKSEILVSEKKLIAPSNMDDTELEQSRPIGNRSEAYAQTEKILNSAENSRIQYTDKNGIQFSNDKAEIAFQSQDDESGIDYIEYELNENGFKNYTVPILLARGGKNQLKYRSVDRVGNREELNLLEVIVDKNPPSLSASLEGKNFYKDGMLYYEPNSKLVVSAYDGESGIKDIYINLNNNGFLPKSYLDLNFSETGYYTIHTIALDNVSNKSGISTFKFTIDSDPPEPTIFVTEKIVRNGSPICSKKSRVQLRATDRDSGLRIIQYRFKPEEPWVNFGGDFSISPDISELAIEYRAIDNVGNESEVFSYRCPIDREAPKTKMEIKKD